MISLAEVKQLREVREADAAQKFEREVDCDLIDKGYYIMTHICANNYKGLIDKYLSLGFILKTDYVNGYCYLIVPDTTTEN